MSDQLTAATSSDGAFWCSSEAELLSRLRTTAGAEAVDRLRAGGRNVVAEPARYHILGKILRRLIDPLIAILIVAAIVSAAVGDLASGAIILAILTASIGLEVTQENSAEKAVEALKHSVAVHAAVRRDGRAVETPVEEIVSGLVIFLIRTSAPFWKGTPHRILIFTSLGALAVAFAFALTPLGAPFGFVPPGFLVLLAMAVLVIGYLTAAERLKQTAMAHRPRRHGAAHLPARHRYRRR
jgi:hypothetical protein